MTKLLKKNNGIALLITLLILGTLMLTATVLAGIAVKEIVLSRNINQSVIAIYAADSALECHLYYLRKGGGVITACDDSLDEITASSSDSAADCDTINGNDGLNDPSSGIMTNGAGFNTCVTHTNDPLYLAPGCTYPKSAIKSIGEFSNIRRSLQICY